MQARYIREMNRHYLAITISDEMVYGYQIPMLLNNRIGGILPVHMQNTDGQMELYYEVTSWQSLKEYYEAKKISTADIQNLLLHLSHTAEELEQYLLRGTGIVLEPEYIYINTAKMRICFCYDPLRKETVQNCLNRLVCFVMDHIDYENKESVKLAYTLFQESMCENVSVSDFAKLAVQYEKIQGWEQEGELPEENISQEKLSGEILKEGLEKMERREDEQGKWNTKENPERNKKNGEGLNEGKVKKRRSGFIWQILVSAGILLFLIVIFLWFLIELQKRLLWGGKQLAAVGMAGMLVIVIIIVGVDWLINWCKYHNL